VSENEAHILAVTLRNYGYDARAHPCGNSPETWHVALYGTPDMGLLEQRIHDLEAQLAAANERALTAEGMLASQANGATWMAYEIAEQTERTKEAEADRATLAEALRQAGADAAVMREALEELRWVDDCDETCCPTGSHSCAGCLAPEKGLETGIWKHGPNCPVSRGLAPDSGKRLLAEIARLQEVERTFNECQDGCPA